MRRLVPLLLLLAPACDLRSFWGEAFLSDPRQPCGPATACPAGTVCEEASGLCRAAPDATPAGCQAHRDCGPAGLCRIDASFPGAELTAVGGCVPADRICVVSDRCLQGGDGTPERPLCDPGEALAQGGRCAFVLVRPRGDGRRYGGLRLMDRSIVLVGDGRDGAATVGGLEVEGGNLTAVDLIVENPGRTGVRCGRGGRLLLQRVAVQASQIGVEADGCLQATIEASRVSGNVSDGILLGAQEYRVVNTLVMGNAFEPGAAPSGVYIKGGRGLFAFNTVVSNGRMGQDGGGVACTSGPERNVPLSDSIVSGNGVGMQGTQLLGSCRLERVVVGNDGTSLAGAIKMDPRLDPVSFRLTSASDCCVDRAQFDRTVTADHFGAPRPQRAAYDIGFHELQ